MSGRNFPPRSPFYRDADQTLTLSLLRNDRGVRRGERPGSAYAGHATRPDRTARACALGELRAEAADAAPRRRSDRSPEITTLCNHLAETAGSLDMPVTGFLYAARSRLRYIASRRWTPWRGSSAG